MTCLACESQSQRIENEYRSVQVARDVELEELWTLYEDTGFLYPEKIERLRSSLPEIHHTIGALLRANGDLLETVTTRLDGTLSGHLCALRAYRRTWVIQHLAARRRLGGAGVLNLAIARYTQVRPDVHWLKMYFRPDNAFPRTVFGSYAESVRHSPKSDLREFRYLTADANRPGERIAGVTVRTAIPADHRVITDWFVARGRTTELMANDLVEGQHCLPMASARFAQIGLRRHRRILAAERDGVVTGFALLEVSSLGMNLSELTNAFTVHLVEPDASSRSALIEAARAHYRSLGRREVVALAESDVDLDAFTSAGFASSKSYLCWTFHRDHASGILDHFEQTFRRSRRTACI